jgi:hypothetical protein
MRDNLSESDRVKSISGSFPLDLGLTGPGCQKWRGYLKATSDASFHTFRLTFCRAFSTVAVVPDQELLFESCCERISSGLV